jgi:hypothetical protein
LLRKRPAHGMQPRGGSFLRPQLQTSAAGTLTAGACSVVGASKCRLVAGRLVTEPEGRRMSSHSAGSGAVVCIPGAVLCEWRRRLKAVRWAWPGRGLYLCRLRACVYYQCSSVAVYQDVPAVYHNHSNVPESMLVFCGSPCATWQCLDACENRN